MTHSNNKKTPRCQGVASSLCHLLRLFDEAQCTFSAYGLGEDRSFRAEGASKKVMDGRMLGVCFCLQSSCVFFDIPNIFPFKDSRAFRIFCSLAQLAPVKHDGYAMGCWTALRKHIQNTNMQWEIYLYIYVYIYIYRDCVPYFSSCFIPVCRILQLFFSQKIIIFFFPSLRVLPFGFVLPRWWRRVTGQCFRNTWEALWSITNLGVRNLDDEWRVGHELLL